MPESRPPNVFTALETGMLLSAACALISLGAAAGAAAQLLLTRAAGPWRLDEFFTAGICTTAAIMFFAVSFACSHFEHRRWTRDGAEQR